MSEKLQANWDCGSNGMFIHAPGLGSGVRVIRSPTGSNLNWNPVKSGFVDHGGFDSRLSYTYSARGFTSSDESKKRTNCPYTAGRFLNLSSIPSISEVLEDDQSTSQGEYQLVVPRYAAVNEYIHGYVSILDGRWLHANTLSPPDGDTKGQAISAWLFQSSSRILSVIARERSSLGGSDFLVGYEITFDKPRPDGGKHKRVWVGPDRLADDTGRPIDGVTGTAAFLLTNFNEENLFHLLVPRMDEVSRESRIEHYTQEESIRGQWTHVATLQPPSDVPGTKITAVTFVQSSQGKFEAVARVTPPNGDNYLVGYELDAVNNQKDWSPPFRLVADTASISVTGSPTIIESDFGEEDRFFHLLVPNKAVTVHYTQAVGSFSKGQWKPFATLNPFQNLPVTAVSLVENQVGGFEAVTRVQRPQGDELVIGYELKPGTTQWSDGVALNADDGPILAGKPTPPVDELPTNPIG